ncbi:phosphoglycerate kinase [Algibacter lectus]|uniref:Phosphoglycerate kinase n=1 Tax=Algibacter lectus TaxID=221126 RepID=A0A090WQZ6_9FLAO|nr:phosphoglycerate kinase [Algibacter lectus]
MLNFNGKKCFGSLLAQEIESINKVMETGGEACFSYSWRSKSIV